MRIFKKPEAQTFADLSLPNGTLLRVPGVTPQVGQTPQLVSATGDTGPVPDGTYHTQNGYTVQLYGGRIAGVSTGPEGPAEPDAATLRQQLDQLRQAHTALQKQLDEPAAAPLQTRGQQEAAAFHAVPHYTARPRHKLYNLREVADGVRLIRRAKSGDPEYRFNHVAARQWATGAGVDFTNLLERCPDMADQLFHLLVVEEGLADLFTMLEVNVNGSASVSVDLPALNDIATDGYLLPGIGCAYTPDGETLLTKRTMEVKPWHYYREYCPKEWGNSFRGLAYVNDEQLPYESVILEFLFAQIRRNWERLLFLGNDVAPSTDPFRGLVPQILADTAIPGGQQVAVVPTPTTAVAQFELLLNAIPQALWQESQQEPLVWFTPNQHLDMYMRNYRQEFKQVPYNTQFAKYSPDSSFIRALFHPTSYLTNRQIVTTRRNLFVGIGKNLELQVKVHDAGRTQYLYVRVEGHTGVGYASSEALVLGNPPA
jgi:hypothetical protein